MAACSELSEETATKLEQQEKKPCTEAVLSLDLTTRARVAKTSVYVTTASVALAEGGTLFLDEAAPERPPSSSPKVRGAGSASSGDCTPRWGCVPRLPALAPVAGGQAAASNAGSRRSETAAGRKGDPQARRAHVEVS
jgi:hypothetical protein